MNETSTSAEEVSAVISGAVGVPAGQVSEYEQGEITDNRGYYFSSQDGLDLADNFLLSMDKKRGELDGSSFINIWVSASLHITYFIFHIHYIIT